MSITQKKLRIKTAPRSQGSLVGESYLIGLLGRDDPNFPRRQIAPLTEAETDNTARMQGYIDNGTEGGNLAMSEFQKILGDGYDPRTSDYYKGFRQEAEALKDQSNRDILRRANMGGMLNSTPTGRMAAENSQRYNNMVLEQLGQMYENERSRRMSAASGAADLGQQRVGNLLASQNFIAQPRQISQEMMNAEYEELVNDLLAPYNIVAPIAMNMFGHQPDYYSIGGGDKDWVKDMGIISGMAAGLFA